MENVNLKAFRDYVQAHVGQKFAFLCARYQYRGWLTQVLEDSVVLSDACCVEVSGPAIAPQPNTEDPIGGSVCIKLDAIEIGYQPPWCLTALPSEEGYRENARQNS